MLAAAIAREGAKAVAAGLNPMDLKRGIDLAVEGGPLWIQSRLNEASDFESASLSTPDVLRHCGGTDPTCIPDILSGSA